MNAKLSTLQQSEHQIDTLPLPTLQEARKALTAAQIKHLDALISRYNQATKTSKQLAQTYRSVLADKRLSIDFNLLTKEMHYPIVVERALGSKVWDIDGNEYIDLIMGYGINLFGYNPSFIKEVLLEQLEKGIQIGSQAEWVGEVAEAICEMTGMERVTFSNTGTEAVMTAIRLARTVTGRSKIVMFSGSYHGHSDGTLFEIRHENGNLQTLPTSLGIPPNSIEDVLVLEYGNSQTLEIIKSHEQDLAAILVEPVQSRRPNLQPKEFLQQLRQLTQKAGIALIFDEMITGFRIHTGGAQAWFGIEADLATYGKIVGGGMPIGIIAGKAKYMDAIDGGYWNYGDSSYPQTKPTFFAGTFCKHPLAIAAARIVLKYLKTQGSSLQEQLNQRTSQFVKSLNDYFAEDQVPIRMANFGSLFGTASSGDSNSAENSAYSLVFNLLYYHLFDRKVLLRGGGSFLSTAHSDEDIDYILWAVKDSVRELREGGFLPS
ncbi:MAG: aspartate aminotransferase family protein [Coleofasciculus sp. S288]|nr:aspartate aminotransferase family protein [Coleofasciculus sp. S288]